MAPDDAELSIRLATIADAPACNEFYNHLHGTQRTIDHWRWEFAPDDQEPSAYVVAENDGKIAGIQALIPIRLIDAHGPHSTAKSEDTLVDPALRGKGALAAMYRLIFERARETGTEAIWGFTEATRAFEKLGFRTAGSTGRLLAPLRADAIMLLKDRFPGWPGRLVLTLFGRPAMAGLATIQRARRSMRRESVRQGEDRMSIMTATAPPEGAGALMESFVSMWGGVTILRDEAYLSWRVFSNPWTTPVMRCAYRGGRLVGWTVCAVGRQRIGYVVDIIAANDSCSRADAELLTGPMLADALDTLSAMGAVAAVLMTATSHPYGKVVERAGRRLGFLSAGRGNPAVLWTDEADTALADFDDWYVTRIFTEGVDG